VDYYDGVQVIIKGHAERIYTQFKNSSGVLTDPSTPKVQIYNPDGTVFVASTAPTKETTGVYYYTVNTSTASSQQEGLFSAYWWGTIGGSMLTMDIPQYVWIQRPPQTATLKAGEEFVQAVRRFIGDTNPSNYRIADHDLRYFIKDAIAEVQSQYNMGYSVTVTPAAIEFSSTPTQIAESLFKIKTAELVVRHILGDVLFSGGALTLGDIKINMKDVIAQRKEYVRDLEMSFNKLIDTLKRNSVDSGGYLINTYLDASCGKYNLSYIG
jgi:hypothetical protein